MKIAQAAAGVIVLALSLAVNVHAQNVGIGFSNSEGRLLRNVEFKIVGGRSRNGSAEESGDHDAGESERQREDRGIKAILDSLIVSIG